MQLLIAHHETEIGEQPVQTMSDLIEAEPRRKQQKLAQERGQRP
jgi:hypothetical protein